MLFAAASLQASPDTHTKIYSLSVAELEKQIVEWLADSGFEVRRRSLGLNQVELKAQSGAKSWEINLRPSSPIATEIQATYRVGPKADEEGIQELWERISAYAREPSLKSENKRQAIPDTVLSLIGATVCLKAVEEGEGKVYQSSGFILDRRGLILSVAHGAEITGDFIFILPEGKEVKAELVKIDRTKDLALFRANTGKDTGIPIRKRRDPVRIGEKIYSIGCPFGLRSTVLSGTINGPVRLLEGLPLWQVDMDVYPGSSGSPVVDTQGHLVGMLKCRQMGTVSIGFLIPLGTIIEFVE
jgi:S1-C subfamily serine protease